MTRVPRSFVEALKSGYKIIDDSGATRHGKRVGMLRLKNGTRRRLVVKYYADRGGYAFSEPRTSVA